MSIDRRSFMKYLGLSLGAASLSGIVSPALAADSQSFLDRLLSREAFTPDDDDFWGWVQQSYGVSPNIINLNNGGVSPQPRIVQETFEKYNRLCNEAPSYYMWRILDQGREPLRYDLAQLAGCSPQEISINRNTTEAMNIIIYGIPLKAGDEVVLAKQDYPNVMNTWKLREKRDGIVLKWVDLDLPSEDADYMTKAYVDQFTSKTKVVNITHIINWIGQIIPVRKIADVAHSRDIEVMVDGAHSFALLDFKIPDLGCDYFGTSLHKWLCAPFGNGLLYVKHDKIGKLWNLSADDDPLGESIMKFERLGTRSFPAELAIGSSLDFQNVIGSKRKEDRIRYLKNYWMERVKDIPGVKLHTSLKPDFSCAIGLFSIDGLTPGETDSQLMEKYKIHTTTIDYEKMHGVRVTPHVYTTTRDLDKLVEAIGTLAKK